MSWDVIVFNLNKKVENADEINDSVLSAIGTNREFKALIEKRYNPIKWEGNWGIISGINFSIEFGLNDNLEETLSHQVFHLYGENAIYEIIDFCRTHNWQAFDTGIEQMLDLEKPEKNGYANFRNYLDYVVKKLT
ncbi:hypothetical protein [Haliscomenobacter hydrossis]|uniref:Uncharacterized protein n=1 Tax=Haliscomenobacter hydrossis (strain ATCC 27775 / DSM 1100 / LMG 10767 / O) TaxID=760192 RepID=F4KUU2_HALH1|nr:hypothetical protein [Haliscomenobacter hydrossis]AEE48118.1 hypothetical protein Halhy_0205 [Haliscomenobacter hydrossis DSM 1100]